MATQQDLQELLRLLTVGRKLPMMQAMGQIKALQAVDLRSIKQIADAPLATVESAITDAKAAKTLQSACKAAVKRGVGGKRPAPESDGAGSSSSKSESAAKRARTGFGDEEETTPSPQDLEDSLALPLCTDEERISRTAVQTNRAPLVLAFAVELLRFTMPEQPPSSRLSLAQAVVSANSRSKAVSIGIARGPSADDEGWAEGQPRVRVLGREVAVLKRGGYRWRGDEQEKSSSGVDEEDAHGQASSATTTTTTSTAASTIISSSSNSWAASQPVSLKSSTFIARATQITAPAQREPLIESLLNGNPTLKTATHNAWAYRIAQKPRTPGIFGSSPGPTRMREDSFDDGETGCGAAILRAMRDAGAVDTLVVLTRWYGGVMLGPDRWRIMRGCVDAALAERLRRTGADAAATLEGEAVWGLDVEAMRAGRQSSQGQSQSQGRSGGASVGVVGMPIHRPEAARAYLLKNFGTAEPLPPPSSLSGEKEKGEEKPGGKAPAKKTQKALDAERETNLGLLLGAIRLLLESWASHLTTAELDRRAWGWYVAVRPDVESGAAGWGAKGRLELRRILELRRG